MVTTHRAPLFFCAPGSREYGTETLKSTIKTDEWNDPAVWQPGSRIRVKVLPRQTTFDVILNIIKATALDWADGMEENFVIEWVSENEAADVRISFCLDEPMWSCLGRRATMYDQSKATMNFAFGGWQSNTTVYSHAHIARAAAHLFGRALGLPHAYTTWPSSWNESELIKQCGQYFAEVVMAENGCSNLKSPQSIMRFDRPSFLGSGADVVQGGIKIDDESRALLRKLYSPFDIFSVRLEAKQMSGFRIGSFSTQGVQRCDTKRTANAVSGLCGIDLGMGYNFRLKTEIANIVPGSALSVQLGAWWDTDIYNAQCNVLAFGECDQRVQTGRVQYIDVTHTIDNPPGKSVYSDVQFARPFKKPPKVVTFISALDTKKGLWIRLNVFPSDVTQNGFRVNMNTWADTVVHNVAVSWLAHELDEPTIRSGFWDNPPRIPNAMEERSWIQYSSPMNKKPRYMFTAFNLIDGRPDRNVRLLCTTPDWDKVSVYGACYTWAAESAFCQVKACYVAIL